VKAQDKPPPFGLDPYFHPTEITIPQTNFRIGYFINDKWNVSLGFDHMKYVVEANQVVNISGNISLANEFNGVYNNDSIKLISTFLEYEHTDGLNYINVELRRNIDLLQTGKTKLALVTGGGIAAIIPRTKTVLFNQLNRDAYQLSGFGIAPLLSMKLTFWDWFFLQSEFKGGYIHMPNVRITPQRGDNASQSFFLWSSKLCFCI